MKPELLMLLCALLPVCLTSSLMTGTTGTTGRWRTFGVIGTLIVPLVFFAVFQATVPAPSEIEDGWGWAFAMIVLITSSAVWFVSALIGCLVGWRILSLRSRRKKAEAGQV